jgi:hypothetical protein
VLTREALRLIDDVAVARYGDTSPDVLAFWRAWDAWGIWANGGFEMVFTGGLADDLPVVIDALVEVDATMMADLFRRAAAVLPDDVLTTFEARTNYFEESDDDTVCAALDAWKSLDDEMALLPPISDYLWPVLERRPHLRADV